MAEKERSDYMVRIDVMGTEKTWLQQRPKKAETMSKAQWSFASSMPRMPWRVKKPLRAWAL